MFDKKSKTDKFLLGLIVLLALILVANVFISGPAKVAGVSAEGEDSEKSEESEESEESEDDEKSEISEISVASEPSSSSVKSVDSESSSKLDGEISEKSTISEDEASEESVASVKSISEFDEVVAINGETAIVKKGEKLFFLIPVEVESEVTLNAEGKVIDERKSILNWLLSVLSF